MRADLPFVCWRNSLFHAVNNASVDSNNVKPGVISGSAPPTNAQLFTLTPPNSLLNSLGAIAQNPQVAAPSISDTSGDSSAGMIIPALVFFKKIEHPAAEQLRRVNMLVLQCNPKVARASLRLNALIFDALTHTMREREREGGRTIVGP